MVTSPPTQQGFIDFIRGNMGITTAQLPDAAPVIPVAYAVAVDLVNDALGIIGAPIYALAVYNLAADNLVRFAPDQSGQTVFAKLRETLKIGTFVAGVIQSAGDNSTSDSLLVPDFMKGLTLANLQNLQTPWGRQYLAFAQAYGTPWGIS